MGRLFGFVAELFERTVAVAPVLEYLDIKVEEAFLASEFLDVFAGFHTDFFDGETFVADEDGALGLAFDVDDGADAVDSVFFLIAFYRHFATVGDFFLVIEEEFFADDFAYEEAHGAVGEFVFWKVWRVFGE